MLIYFSFLVSVLFPTPLSLRYSILLADLVIQSVVLMEILTAVTKKAWEFFLTFVVRTRIISHVSFCSG